MDPPPPSPQDMPFPDGDPPTPDVVDRWLGLCRERFGKKGGDPKGTIAVHCVAGLGRAPVLVAIALIEQGMGNLEVINFVRGKRWAWHA